MTKNGKKKFIKGAPARKPRKKAAATKKTKTKKAAAAIESDDEDWIVEDDDGAPAATMEAFLRVTPARTAKEFFAELSAEKDAAVVEVMWASLLPRDRAPYVKLEEVDRARAAAEERLAKKR